MAEPMAGEPRAARLLRGARCGERAATDDLVALIYDELRNVAGRFMAGERRGHTLQTTALVNEAYLRLIQQANVDPADRQHFLAVAATIIRRILVDHARQHRAAKRGRGWAQISVDAADAQHLATADNANDLIALEEALEKLGQLSDRAARVVTMRFYAGLSVDEVAAALQVSPRTVADDWAMARAWLKRELGGP